MEKKAVIPDGSKLHVAVKLLLLIASAVLLSLYGSLTDLALVWLLCSHGAYAQRFEQAGFLHLALEALLQPVITFFASLVCMNSHNRSSRRVKNCRGQRKCF